MNGHFEYRGHWYIVEEDAVIHSVTGNFVRIPEETPQPVRQLYKMYLLEKL